MALSSELLRSWRNPGASVRRQLAAGATEGRALAYLMAGCALVFVAQWPRLAREAALQPEVPLEARLGATMLAWVFFAPLVFYALAGLSHLLARLIGGRGSFFGARLALFWSLLVAAPLFLLYGLVAGLIGPGPAMQAAGAALAGGFLVHWTLALVAAQTAPLEAPRARA